MSQAAAASAYRSGNRDPHPIGSGAPQGGGCLLLNHLVQETSHPLAQLGLDRVEPDLPVSSGVVCVLFSFMA